MNPLISTLELKEFLGKENSLIIHAGNGARDLYKKQHINGALYMDLDEHLSDIKENPANGGRHPLPDIEVFNQTLGEFGISPETHVIVYDDKNCAIAASRLWWMLLAVGHEKVQVLNGGLQAAVRDGIPVNNTKVEKHEVKRAPLTFTEWQLPTVTMEQVEEYTKNPEEIIVDVRAIDRYNGETEPIDPIAGHIPSAINIPFASNLDKNGLYLPPEELAEKYTTVFGNTSVENVTFHCGSGVTACHSLLAIASAGFSIPNLYVGSWSEWCRNDKVMITK